MSTVLPIGQSDIERARVLFARGEWSDAATLTASGGAVEAGTLVTDLQRKQAGDFFGQTSPCQINADRTTRQPLDIVSLPYSLVTSAATWRIRFGDTTQERDGTHLQDAGPSNRDATLVNAPPFVPGVFGGALNLPQDGVDQYGSTGGFTGPAAWTMEGLLRTPTLATMSVMTHAGTAPRLMEMDASGQILMAGRTSAALSANTWWHVALTHTGTTSILYTTPRNSDGTWGTTTSTSGSNSAANPTGAFIVGTDQAVFNLWIGDLDEIRYWPVVRTPAQLDDARGRELTDAEAATTTLYFRMNGYDSGTIPFPAAGAFVDTLSDGRASSVVWSELPDQRCHAFHFLPQRLTARFCRIDVTDAGLCRFGRLLIGKAYQPSIQGHDKGRSHGFTDDTDTTRGPGGVMTADGVDAYPGTSFAMDYLTQEDMYRDLYRLQQLYAGGRPGLVVLNPTDPEFLQYKIFYGHVTFEEWAERDFNIHRVEVRVEGMP